MVLSIKIRLRLKSFSNSFITGGKDFINALSLVMASRVKSRSIPPKRPMFVVRRAPHISSYIPYISSLFSNKYKNPVKAPASTPKIPLQIKWSATRANSIIITLMYWALFGTSTPNSFSTVIIQPKLLIGDEQ